MNTLYYGNYTTILKKILFTLYRKYCTFSTQKSADMNN